MFKKKYTKWTPLGNFNFSSYDYITFVRKNLKTGMLQFRTKRVNGWFGVMGCTNSFLPKIIDTQKVWNEITQKQ